MAKDSYFYELKINPNLKYKPQYTSYFIPCISMEELDIVECPCAPNAQCTWMRSVEPLPDFKGEKLSMVSTVDVGMKDDFGYVAWDSIYDIKNSRRPQRLNHKYSIRNIAGDKYLYLHIFDNYKPKKLSVFGPFDDLLEVVQRVQNQCGEKKTVCNFFDTPLDIPQMHRDKIFLKAYQIVKTLEDKNIFPDRKTDDKDGSKYIQQTLEN